MAGRGTRSALVAPERLDGWLDRFTASHGATRVTSGHDHVEVLATDGSSAHCRAPFPPLTSDSPDPHDPWRSLVQHALQERRFGVLLIRRGGYAAGIFEGDRLVSSKVGTRYVQGRTAAGGQSQQRFARRRDNQATALVGSAVQVAARILAPESGSLAALVTGGDRKLIADALADPRLAGLAGLPRSPWLPVADPRLAVLRDAGKSARWVSITVVDG